EDTTSYLRGLVTGEAWTYGDNWYRRDFIGPVLPRFVRSLRYLMTSAVLATLLGLLAGAWLTAARRDRLKDVVTFAGAVPDFVLALLLQLAVVAVYRATGFRVARVASLTNRDAAVLLPLISLTLVPAVYLARSLSARAYVIASEDFVLVSKAMGQGRPRIWLAQILPNLTAFLRADLAKVCGMMLANFFIVDYLYNLKGVTTMLFMFGFTHPYQYNLTMDTFIVMIVLYVIIYVGLRGLVRVIDGVAVRL
ncbi:MAG TPA: ABC transporter permease subunit, partial [Thermoleophilia bacterium]|nr:ABC transporter permease subunit [Thermoleophilia bacterium]